MKLTNPTNEQINAAVAEYVAGWKKIPEATNIAFEVPETGARGTPPDFATSADALLPLLEKLIRFDVYATGNASASQGCRVYVWDHDDNEHRGVAQALPLAACIALLRAHGVEVEFTE